MIKSSFIKSIFKNGDFTQHADRTRDGVYTYFKFAGESRKRTQTYLVLPIYIFACHINNFL